MIRLFIFILPALISLGFVEVSAADKSFLFQSVSDPNDFLFVPRDLKTNALIFSFPSKCGDCIKKAEKLLLTLADEKLSSKMSLIILVESSVWRLSRADYGPRSSLSTRLQKHVWHDPGSRFRSEFVDSDQPTVVAYSPLGKILFKESYSSQMTATYLIKRVSSK